MVSKSNESTLRRAALDYLARREYSFYELKQKLYSKFPTFDVELIHHVIAALRAENLQSDERFEESYSRYRKSRGFGYNHIRNSLCQKKIEHHKIDQYLVVDDPEWVEIAVKLVKKKSAGRKYDNIDIFERSKITRFMEGRGSMPRQIQKAIKLTNNVHLE